MTCYRNLFKHFKKNYRTKISKNVTTWFSIFWKSNDFFPQKPKVIKYSLLIFIFHICADFKPEKQEMCIWMFLITLSHFERSTWILCMMGAITIFGESSFIFSFVGYGLVIKSLEVGCIFEKVEEKTKCQKMNVSVFPSKLGWIISPSF